jgi:hypothetical protein
LYGCETWSLTLREEHRLRAFENSVLRRIFGPKRDERENGESSKVGSFIICARPDIVRQIKSRRMRWARNVARMGERRNLHRVSVEKPEGKRQLERPRRRWKDGIGMDLREFVWGECGVDSPGSG